MWLLHQAVKKRGFPLSVETCAHYLTFQSDGIVDGDTRFKCAPPLRDGANRQLLLQGVQEGVIDIISSDHSPAPPDLKELESGDFLKAWGGISGEVQKHVMAVFHVTNACCYSYQQTHGS